MAQGREITALFFSPSSWGCCRSPLRLRSVQDASPKAAKPSCLCPQHVMIAESTCRGRGEAFVMDTDLRQPAGVSFPVHELSEVAGSHGKAAGTPAPFQPGLGKDALQDLNFSVPRSPEQGHQQTNSSFSKSSYLLALRRLLWLQQVMSHLREQVKQTLPCSAAGSSSRGEHSTRGSCGLAGAPSSPLALPMLSLDAKPGEN